MLRQLSVKTINIPQSNLPRVITGTKSATVENYAEQMADGIKFPAIKVWKKDGSHWLVWDGVHRLSAAKTAGAETIDCEVYNFPENEFLLRAFSANLKHGLPLRQQEKITVTQTLYQKGHSIQEIAKKTAISERTLYRWLQPVIEKQKETRNENIRKLHEQGQAKTKIAERVGVTRQTVQAVLQKIDSCQFFTPAASTKNNNPSPEHSTPLNIKYKDMSYDKKLELLKMPIKDCVGGEKLSDLQLKIARSVELIKTDWSIEEIQKEVGLSRIAIRHVAVGMMAQHDKKLFYEKGPRWVAGELQMNYEELHFLWQLRHFETVLPDRFQLLSWIRGTISHNSDIAVRDFMRIETLNQLCIEHGVDTPDKLNKELKYEDIKELPQSARTCLQNCADGFNQLINMFTHKRLQKKPLQELSGLYNQLVGIENRFRDILIENSKKF